MKNLFYDYFFLKWNSVISVSFFIKNANAQEKIIHGAVTTFDSIPVVNAEVIVKSSKRIFLTDTLGRFAAVCENEDKLKIVANVFNNQSIKLNNDTKIAAINLKLKPGEKARSHAIGYGHILDENKLNAVARLNNDDVDFSNYTNMYDLIRGKFAGVQVINGEVVIRGIKGNSGSSAALIVVDGVPRNGRVLSALAPAQVRSIDIVKDGSTAVYGIKGANGVVLINTKSGDKGF